VVREDPEVEHVGVGEDDVAVAADGRPLLARGVAVVDREPYVLDAERVQGARLVLGERLGGVEVESARAGIAAQHLERRELEAQRLAGGRAGGDDRRARPAGVERVGLVRPQRLDAALAQRLDHRGVQLLGDRRLLPAARVDRGLGDEALVGAACFKQAVPRLDVPDHRHPLSA
jgi:hypothetical protein